MHWSIRFETLKINIHIIPRYIHYLSTIDNTTWIDIFLLHTSYRILQGFRVPQNSDCLYRESSRGDDTEQKLKKVARFQRTDAIRALNVSSGKRYSSATLTSLLSLNEEVVNKDLITELAAYICRTSKQGAILIFVPGLADIKDVIEALKRAPELKQSLNFKILPLHSSLSSAEQVWKTSLLSWVRFVIGRWVINAVFVLVLFCLLCCVVCRHVCLLCIPPACGRLWWARTSRRRPSPLRTWCTSSTRAEPRRTDTTRWRHFASLVHNYYTIITARPVYWREYRCPLLPSVDVPVQCAGGNVDQSSQL